MLSCPSIQKFSFSSASITQPLPGSSPSASPAPADIVLLCCSGEEPETPSPRATWEVLHPPKLQSHFLQDLELALGSICLLNGKCVRSSFVADLGTWGAGGEVLFLSFVGSAEVTELEAESHHMPWSLETSIKIELSSQCHLQR